MPELPRPPAPGATTPDELGVTRSSPVEPLVISRRQFLGGAGAAGILLTVASTSACDGPAAGSPNASAPRSLGDPSTTLAASPPPPPTPVGGPRRSDEMVEMIGALVHLTGPPNQSVSDHRSDFLYSRYRDAGPTGGPGWLGLLAGAGFRHVRCDTGGGITPSDDPAKAFALETMRLLDTTKPAHSPVYRTGIDKAFLSSGHLGVDLPVLRALAGQIWMIEGPNESWFPDAKFLPSFVDDDGATYTCLHAIASTRAIPPSSDPGRWQVCRSRGLWSGGVAYAAGDLVSYRGHLWAAPWDYGQPAGTEPSITTWWDLTAWNMPKPFPDQSTGVYGGLRAGEVGVAWGEYFGDLMTAEDGASGPYWTSAGRWGAPVRLATPSEAGVDIFAFWTLPGDPPLLRRYEMAMPGGATNVHLYEGGQPEDMPATLAAAVAQAQLVLPGYPIYLGEAGQATYPTDDALALGTDVVGAVPAMVIRNGAGAAFPADSHGRPIPATTTGRFGAEAAQAQKLLRVWAELFRSGPPGSRLTVYELLNEPFSGFGDYTGTWGYPDTGGPHFDYNRSEGNFGLIRSDFTVKPAFSAIASTVALMGDPGDHAFSPENLDFEILRPQGPQPSADPSLGEFDEIRSVLTQGSDGDFRVVVYYSNVHDTDELLAGMGMNRMAVPSPAERVTFTLFDGRTAHIEAYNTQLGATAPVQTVAASSSITWTLTADLWIVKVRLLS